MAAKFNLKSILKAFSFSIFIAIVLAILIVFRDKINLQNVQHFINSVGIWAPIIFIGIYIIATVSFLPGSVITLAGGLIFGPVLGVVYNATGAVIGATLAFIISRYFAGDWVRHKTGGKLKILLDGIEKEGWKFVAVLRLVPLFPFNLLNYALGLTPIRLGAYVLATAIFILPGTITYTYIGSLGETFIHGNAAQIISRVFIAVGLLILLAIIPYVVKKWRGGLK